MWLINVRTYALEQFLEDKAPKYSILSHTWGEDEASFQDMQTLRTAKGREGFKKIEFTCLRACEDGFSHAWVDTCCIDKSSSAELQEAINSMYRWYRKAQRCYVFLGNMRDSCPDLNGALDQNDSNYWHRKFQESPWFLCGWTLQELLAPADIQFFGSSGNYIGNNRGKLMESISQATRIEMSYLSGQESIARASVAQRMSWAARRRTSRPEDMAYCLLGIFDLNMPMLYGEGRLKAFRRLQEEIMKTSTDHTIFAWDSPVSHEPGLLASSPYDFLHSGSIRQCGRPLAFEMTNRGLRISLPIIEEHATSDLVSVSAVLCCRYRGDQSRVIALQLVRMAQNDDLYRVGIPLERTGRLARVSTKRLLGVPTRLVEISASLTLLEAEVQYWIEGTQEFAQVDGYTMFRSWHPLELSISKPVYRAIDYRYQHVAAVVLTTSGSGKILIVLDMKDSEDDRETLLVQCKHLMDQQSVEYDYGRIGIQARLNAIRNTEANFGEACVRLLFDMQHVSEDTLALIFWLMVHCEHDLFPCASCYTQLPTMDDLRTRSDFRHWREQGYLNSQASSTLVDTSSGVALTASVAPHELFGHPNYVVQIR